MSEFFSHEPLQIAQVARITEHKYKSSGKSVCEPFLQPFWNWSAKYIPRRVAPNTLTISGLVGNALSVLLLLCYSPDLRSQIPALPLVLHVLGVFLYQTLDALDGLHARQTNTCSPLGELFDHGCDAIAMTLLALGFFSAMGLGHWPLIAFAEFFILNCVFYTTQWQCYVTGIIEFASFSVTEALLASILFSLVSALFGVDFWGLQDPIFGMELRIIQFVAVVIGSTVLFIRFGQTILDGGSGKFGTTVANTSVLFPVCPLFVVILMAILVAVRSPAGVYQQNISLYLLTFGIVTAKISQNLVVAHMTKSAITLFDSSMLGPFCLLANRYFDCPLNETLVLWFSCAWAVFDVLYFCVRVSIQIANFLNIYMFRVDRPPSQPSRPANKKQATVSSVQRNATSFPEPPNPRSRTRKMP
ncbi:unnamed protein product [Calicophoron daubneyi]|uniref:Choline/ethanolaminephosphotransferase 1 n=1 Tax=Calicophoron daubneyi TaxID=300641 RepID=A0AAV2TNS6_CALDB